MGAGATVTAMSSVVVPAALVADSVKVSSAVIVAWKLPVFIAPVEATDPGLIADVPDDWGQVPMILPASGLARDRVDAWFAELRVEPKVYARVAGNEAIVSMVSLGLGIGVVPQIVLDNSPQTTRVRVLDVSPALAAYDLGPGDTVIVDVGTYTGTRISSADAGFTLYRHT